MPSKEFCGYEMLRRLGRGGMAVVWEARKKALNKRVAIKILRSEFAGNFTGISWFPSCGNDRLQILFPPGGDDAHGAAG